MPTYIALLRYTQKGLETVKDAPTRTAEARKRFEAAGANLKAVYLTLGSYDGVAIVEAPNDAAIAKLALVGGAQGFLRTETLRAFTENEYSEIIKSLP